MKRLLTVSAIALLMLTGCSSNTEEPKPTTSKTTTEAAPSETPKADAEVKIGTPVKAGDWEITINSWKPNVNAEVKAAAPDMWEEPEAGKQFALLNVTMKYIGKDTGDNSSVNVQYMPNGAGSISNLWEAMGTTPGENKLTYEELTPGGSITGDALYLIDANSAGKFGVLAPGVEAPVMVAP